MQAYFLDKAELKFVDSEILKPQILLSCRGNPNYLNTRGRLT